MDNESIYLACVSAPDLIVSDGRSLVPLKNNLGVSHKVTVALANWFYKFAGIEGIEPLGLKPVVTHDDDSAWGIVIGVSIEHNEAQFENIEGALPDCLPSFREELQNEISKLRQLGRKQGRRTKPEDLNCFGIALAKLRHPKHEIPISILWADKGEYFEFRIPRRPETRPEPTINRSRASLATSTKENELKGVIYVGEGDDKEKLNAEGSWDHLQSLIPTFGGNQVVTIEYQKYRFQGQDTGTIRILSVEEDGS